MAEAGHPSLAVLEAWRLTTDTLQRSLKDYPHTVLLELVKANYFDAAKKEMAQEAQAKRDAEMDAFAQRNAALYGEAVALGEAVNKVRGELVTKGAATDEELSQEPREVPDFAAMLQSAFDERLAARAANAGAYANNPVYREFKESTEVDDDLEMDVGPSEISTKCPITQMQIKEPLKIKQCGHTFEADAIRSHIKSKCKGRVNSTKCPVAGCSNDHVKLGDLVINKNMRRLLKDAQQDEAEGEDEDEDEDEATMYAHTL